MRNAALAAQSIDVRAAATVLRVAPTEQKNVFLRAGARALRERADPILSANRIDVERALGSGAAASAVDRLVLDRQRLESMAETLEDVALLPDPVGEVVETFVRPNGLICERVRVPLGVVGVIYENRPNVTSDAASLCVKAGNAAFLRGSGSAQGTNVEVVAALHEGLVGAGLPPSAVSLVEDPSRDTVVEFMRLDDTIDCLIPRGGRGLVEAMHAHATVPCVLDGDGNCHVYVDADADLDVAEAIVVNAKVSRPGVCNAAETLLVHRSVAEALLPRLDRAMPTVELRGDDDTRRLVPRAVPVSDEDYATEFLDLVLAVRVVDTLDAAIDHVQRYSSGHTEVIVTRDEGAQRRFEREVDAAAVVMNASSRFVDGGELGLGAEVGISTQKLHARGPMGLRELTSVRWVLRGDGQTR